jgi:hypothetical protein
MYESLKKAVIVQFENLENEEKSREKTFSWNVTKIYAGIQFWVSAFQAIMLSDFAV